MSKVVVLNSGGFDSIVLLHYLKIIEDRDLDIYSLHFDYGARNEKQQLNCVNKVCNKLDIHNTIIHLPKFGWTKSTFYSKTSKETDYLEWRNLIFMSYAISYAESIGAEEIYLAIIRLHDYKDTSFDFISHIGAIAETSGIYVYTPFFTDSKQRLAHIAKYVGIKEDEYFSCDVPIDNKPCGECRDCKALKEIWKNVL